MQFGGIVLCGGKSTRMGYAKAMLPFGEEVMLQRVVRLLSEAVDPIAVVAAPDQQLPPLPEQTLIARDHREGRGPLEGLLAGLEAVEERCDAAYVSSCDAPHLQPTFVREMTRRLDGHQITVPCEARFCHPLAAVYRKDVRPLVERLLAADRLRPAFLFDQADTLRVPVESLRDVDRELSTLANLNRPEEYLAALKEEGLAPPPEIVQQLASNQESEESAD